MQLRSALTRLSRAELAAYVEENLRSLTEEEALAILDNPYCAGAICGKVAQTQHLTGFYAVRLKLVAHRATPQAHASKLVHYLYWFDLLRLSVDVTVPAPVRRTIETQLLLHLNQLSAGEKIASARACSAALIKIFLTDPDPRVFASLLINPRLREADLLGVAGSEQSPAEHLRLLATDRKWSTRYAIRRSLAMNPATPRAAAASQLRFLTRRDLREIHGHPATTVYVRRCIESLLAQS